MEVETFWTLLRDPAHWYFELLVNLLENLVTWAAVAVVWRKVLEPRIYRHVHRDIEHTVGKKPHNGN